VEKQKALNQTMTNSQSIHNISANIPKTLTKEKALGAAWVQGLQ